MNITHIQNEREALAYGISAVLLWSTVATAFKLGLEYLAIEQLLFLGISFSWLFFTVILLTRGNFFIEKKDRAVAVLLGIINPFAYYLILFSAYDLLPAHIAQPLNYTWAITPAILSVPILKESLTIRTAIGIGVSYLGVTVLLYSSNSQASENITPLGIFLAILSTLFWASYWLISKKSHSDPLSMMFVAFSTALPFSLGVCLQGPGLPELNTPHLLSGLWVGLIEMGLTYLLWQRAISRSANTARIGQLIFLSPFISLVFIYFFLDEKISFTVILSLSIIVLGTWITQKHNSSTADTIQ